MNLGLVVNIRDSKLSILSYANDIVLVALSEADMQNTCMLDKLHNWCKCWRVLINTDKS